jgi:pimeloyl-ACP methyl ester carboxylesterase
MVVRGLSSRLTDRLVGFHAPGTLQAGRCRWFTIVTRLQYVGGARDPELISPDTWTLDQHFLDRPGNAEIQLDLFYDYRHNLAQYPLWQAYFCEHQPPTLVIWGRHDPFFAPAGALAYARDLKDVDVHLINAGHFALEGHVDLYTFLIKRCLKTRLG